jgi:hypothetical protein
MAETQQAPQTPRAAAAACKLAEVGVSLYAVHELVARNEVAAVQALLANKRVSVYATDAGGWSMLHVAARSDAVDTADMLLVRVAAPCGAARDATAPQQGRREMNGRRLRYSCVH